MYTMVTAIEQSHFYAGGHKSLPVSYVCPFVSLPECIEKKNGYFMLDMEMLNTKLMIALTVKMMI